MSEDQENPWLAFLSSEEHEELLRAEDEQYQRHCERVLKLEAAHPGLQFSRYGGSEGEGIPDWGACPEQAVGLWQGDPFYYRVRGNSATLEVWSAELVPPPALTTGMHHWPVPTRSVFPKLAAGKLEVEPGRGYLGLTTTGDLFEQLLSELKPLKPEETWEGQEILAGEEAGLPTARQVGEAFCKRHPAFTVVERQKLFMHAPEVLLRTPENAHLFVKWGKRKDWRTGELRSFLLLEFLPASISTPLDSYGELKVKRLLNDVDLSQEALLKLVAEVELEESDFLGGGAYGDRIFYDAWRMPRTLDEEAERECELYKLRQAVEELLSHL